MLCKHHFSKNGQVFFHIFWVVTLIMQSRNQLYIELETVLLPEILRLSQKDTMQNTSDDK
ncbi:hypothetical protein EVE90_03140 [Lacticaseibacillus paracasei]|nr:hypothetical protein EVE90_03140 [Lacticaseibacillus paracasei]